MILLYILSRGFVLIETERLKSVELATLIKDVKKGPFVLACDGLFVLNSWLSC